MAHELPLLIHTKKSNHNVPPAKAPSSKTNKHKPLKSTSDEKGLPNGAKVDFGNKSGSNTNKKSNKKASKHTSSNSSNSKGVTRVLPDGSKPNFGNEPSHHNGGNNKKHNNEPCLPNGEKPNFGDASKSHSKKKNNEPVLPNGEKPNFFNEKPSKKTTKPKEKKTTITEDTYAGSSFHSSPAALNLPKPSFKTSPKANHAAQNTTDSSYHISPQANVQHLVSAPPQHPVTAYPAGNGAPNIPTAPSNPNAFPPGSPYVQPGFSYYVTPQGYINYQYPHVPPPPPPPQGGVFPMVAPHYQQQPQQQPQQHRPHHLPQIAPQQGQRISFNELLGSSKN
ncbi:Enhancer of mRNA-decapping protein 1 [Debaryomyces fabryi]|uniref:Enhancer of mRNA-decapping protein 1 n=1 Tax=Debaryomyces fabryi TaxID=58627 RepID=A0A0V1Q1T9_9ASCO|nr:Enhancer of mRNA-decapping protein 1 [Debaryomyces fabryi]KSA02500.1 Enhancer of mRNA-decapping protein 1 [Debaryomyces fabryi]